MLDISPILLFSSSLIFLLVLIGLNNLLYKPLMQHMDQRSEKIKNDLNTVGVNNKNLESLFDEANKIIFNAKNECSTIRYNAINRANEQTKILIEDEKTKISNKYAAFLKSISEEKEIVKNGLLADMPFFIKKLQNKINSI